MNQLIQEYFEGRGFSFVNDYGRGIIDGYEAIVNYYPMDNVSPLRISFICHFNDSQKNSFSALFNNIKKRLIKMRYDRFGVTLLMHDWTIKALVEKLDGVLANFTSYLKEVDAKGVGYCPICGETLGEENLDTLADENCVIVVHKECLANYILIDEAERKAYEALPDHYLRGLLGALIGGLVAIFMAIGCAIIGFISSISGFLGMYVGEKCYTKFGGKPSIKMIVTLVVVNVLAMILFMLGFYAFTAQYQYEQMGFYLSAVESFKIAWSVDDFKFSLFKDLLFILAFTGLGIIPSAISYKNSLSNRHRVK